MFQSSRGVTAAYQATNSAAITVLHLTDARRSIMAQNRNLLCCYVELEEYIRSLDGILGPFVALGKLLLSKMLLLLIRLPT